MMYQINKKDRTILFKFGTAKLEGDIFKYVIKFGKDISKAVNKLHTIKSILNERHIMKLYELNPPKRER